MNSIKTITQEEKDRIANICDVNNINNSDYYHLFELGYDVDKIMTDSKTIDLQLIHRQWVLNSIIND